MTDAEPTAPGLRNGVTILARALGMLGPERGRATLVLAAGGLVALLQIAEPVLFGKAVNALSQGRDSLGFILTWCALSLGGFFAAMIVSLAADRMAHRRRLSAMASFVEHLLALPPSFHSEARSGRLMRIMINGCDSLFAIWLPIMREQLTNAVILLALVPVALWTNWRLGAVLLGLMVIYALVNAIVISRTSTGQAEVENWFAEVSGQVGDLFGNVPVLQSFLAIPKELLSIRGLLGRLLDAQYPVLNWWAVMAVLTRGASSISIVTIFAVGAMLVSQGRASVGDIVAFVGFASLLIGRLDQFTGFVMGLSMKAAALGQFFDILDQRSTILEKADAKPLEVSRGHVVFEHVSFRYPKGSGQVHDVSFEVRPGETVAIVGATGAGKSTVIGLLQRAYDPGQGRILVDGQDIRDVTLSSLRAATGVVFQEAGLFNRTIAENIAMGDPAATTEQIEEAARLAGAYDFIMARDGGFKNAIGDHGQGLSGGERQRIAIARALLKNAPILLLDEATSALDVATEARLQQSLERLRSGRTTLVIAHRLSTIRSADRIVVLDQGRVAEQGSFDDLVAAGGIFARLVRDGGLAPTRLERRVADRRKSVYEAA